MTRVSEQSSQASVKYSVGKTKSKLEDLQIRGSNLKKIQRPSDDPIGNIELLAIRSETVDAKQYLKNSNYAKTLLDYTETAVSDLTDIVAKAKEIAIGQASDFYNDDVRRSVAKEVGQLRTQAIAIANKRLGNRYIFSGYKTLTKPFDMEGNYYGDEGTIKLEVGKDFFVPINKTAVEVFYHDDEPYDRPQIPQEQQIPNINTKDPNQPANTGRSLASVQQAPQEKTYSSIFDDLKSLENALMTNNPEIIQGLLERLDKGYDKLISVRTDIGAIQNSIVNTESTIENNNLLNQAYKSKIEDADIADLFSEINKQQNVLKATYKSTAGLLNQSLLDFVR